MNLLPYFKIQKCLDDRIKKGHDIPEDVSDLKVIAFKVELGELGNCTRFFKFWSVKQSEGKEVTLEEFVDGIHFLLSIGLERGWNRFVNEITVSQFDKTKDLSELFGDLFESGFRTCGEWARMFRYYLAVGHKLGFTEDEIEIAYVKKNEKNHLRQNTGTY